MRWRGCASESSAAAARTSARSLVVRACGRLEAIGEALRRSRSPNADALDQEPGDPSLRLASPRPAGIEPDRGAGPLEGEASTLGVVDGLEHSVFDLRGQAGSADGPDQTRFSLPRSSVFSIASSCIAAVVRSSSARSSMTCGSVEGRPGPRENPLSELSLARSLITRSWVARRSRSATGPPFRGCTTPIEEGAKRP